MRPTPDPTALRIRGATHADLTAIAALHTGARAAYHRARHPGTPFDAPAEQARWHDAWAGVLDRADTPALCAERHGTVIGAACYLPHASTARGNAPRTGTARPTVTLHQLHVAPAHWGTGVGRALHTACLRAWRTAGFARAVLDVRWHNHRARAFYDRLGWRPDPDRRPAPDATHLTLALDLTGPAPEAPPSKPSEPSSAGR
ncbi:GNAT family N-acetyltransferase [Streptomyces sp. NPDC059649]|uniref:GNAT family N-acetyltransferase n=1 Tax=Streptomyces sp. NPDC059649 TaxID=3346895 RepID=UPI003696EB41